MVNELINFFSEDPLRIVTLIITLVFIFSLGFIVGDMLMNRYDKRDKKASHIEVKSQQQKKKEEPALPSSRPAEELIDLVDWEQKSREDFPAQVYIVLRVLTKEDGEVSYFKMYDLEDRGTTYPWRISLTGEKVPLHISNRLDDLNAKRDFLEVISNR